jgi:soluble lytic murein transglycosylase
MDIFNHKIHTPGLFIVRPVALILIVVYILHLGVIVYLLIENSHKNKIIFEQENKINELEEKLKILDIIEDYQIGFNQNEIKGLTEVIYTESKRFSIDPLLIISLIMTESSFKKGQKSYRGAKGLMQVIPSTAKDVAKKWGVEWPEDIDLWNPSLNIRVGSAYLFELILKFKSVRKAIIAYNLGETNLREFYFYKAKPPARYYEKVVSNYKMLKNK